MTVKRRQRRKIWLKSLSLGVSLLSMLSPGLAAERIYVSYLFLERSISVRALEIFAKEGQITSDLVSYARYLNPEQRQKLRAGLLQRLDLDAVAVAQFLYTPIGERLLDRVGEVVQTKPDSGRINALRAALIAAAADSEGLTTLNVLRQYPTLGVKIDLTAGANILANVQQLIAQTNTTVGAIQRQVPAEVNLKLRREGQALQRYGPFSPPQKITLDLEDNSPKRLAYTQQSRKFMADVYLPALASPQPRPVIVISHGLNSDRSSYAYLAKHLASYGFVVAVPEHPGSSTQQLLALIQGQANDITKPEEFLDRPLDVTFLLDDLERRSQSDSRFQNRLNLEQVGIVGQSFGGYTALALAGAPINFTQLQQDCTTQLDDTFNLSLLLQCQALRLPSQQYDLGDPRIGATMAINPIGSSLLGQAGFSQIPTPVMIVAGSADTVAPALQEQFPTLNWLTTPDKYLMLIEGSTHFSTIAPPQTASDGLPQYPRMIGPAPELARNYLQAGSVAFFNAFINQQPKARAYLTPNFAAALSQQPLPVYLTQTVPLSEISKDDRDP